MARSQPAGPARARRPRPQPDSSRIRGQAAVAVESRLFLGVQVCGRVAGWSIPAAALRGLLAQYLRALGLPQAQLTLRLVGERVSQNLNRRFRALDHATDILSFPALPGRSPRGFGGYLGDLALCLPYAWRKRGRFEARFEAEAALLILHGLLHLTGRHHDTPAQERELWRLQKSILPVGRGSLPALAKLRPVKMRS